MKQTYTNTQEHIQDTAIVFDMLLYSRLLEKGTSSMIQNMPSIKEGMRRKAYILTGKKVQKLLANTETQCTAHDIQDCIPELKKEVSKRIEDSLKQGVELRLYSLSKLYNLTEIETMIIAVLFSSFAYDMYNAISKLMERNEKALTFTPELLHKILQDMPADENEIILSVSPGSKLFENSLCRYIETDKKLPFALRQLELEERVYTYLSGNDSLEPALKHCTALYSVDNTVNNPVSETEREKLLTFITGTKTPCIHFYADYDIEDEVPQALCSDLKVPLLSVNMKRSSLKLQHLFSLLHRESKLQNAAVCLYNINELLNTDNTTINDSQKDAFINLANSLDTKLFVCSQKQQDLHVTEQNNNVFSIEIETPSVQHRMSTWQRLLPDTIDMNDIAILAETYTLSDRQIERAVQKAGELALYHNKDVTGITLQGLYEACKMQMNHNLTRLAKKVETRATWDDIVLPFETKEQLQEFTARYLHRSKVYKDWNFTEKSHYGNGLVGMFHGVSGTGKTLAAQIIGNELNLDLYVINLATIVSKYIGETEKNLEKIFKEAERSNAILFFDEADALFGKRSQVKDAHDRYANIEVGYLLQRIEEYDGIIILATNMIGSIDPAFARRVKYKIEFKKPEETERHTLWEKVFPKEAPVSDDIDFQFIAENFEFNGAEIKDILETAMFMAANEGTELITMKHLILAIRKMKIKNSTQAELTDKTFGDYFHYIKDLDKSKIATKPQKVVPSTRSSEDRTKHETTKHYDENGKIKGRTDHVTVDLEALAKIFEKTNKNNKR